MLNKSAEFNLMIGVNYKFLQSEKNFFNATCFCESKSHEIFALKYRSRSILVFLVYWSTTSALWSKPYFKALLNCCLNSLLNGLLATQQAKTNGRFVNLNHSSARSYWYKKESFNYFNMMHASRKTYL